MRKMVVNYSSSSLVSAFTPPPSVHSYLQEKAAENGRKVNSHTRIFTGSQGVAIHKEGALKNNPTTTLACQHQTVTILRHPSRTNSSRVRKKRAGSAHAPSRARECQGPRRLLAGLGRPPKILREADGQRHADEDAGDEDGLLGSGIHPTSCSRQSAAANASAQRAAKENACADEDGRGRRRRLR
jgi:hypothetical protein